jgi:two-component system cell cycle response regulator DivK
MYLEHSGLRCVEAADGRDAVALAYAHRPALILMDATMPGINGWEAVRQIKADPALRDTRVIMLTAHAFAEHRERAMDVGADEFVAKPVLPNELLEIIRRVLKP